MFIKRQRNKDKITEKGKAFTSAFGWKDCELFPEGLFLNLMLAGETFNSFQMDGIAKKMGPKIYKLDFLCEYKRRRRICLFLCENYNCD